MGILPEVFVPTSAKFAGASIKDSTPLLTASLIYDKLIFAHFQTVLGFKLATLAKILAQSVRFANLKKFDNIFFGRNIPNFAKISSHGGNAKKHFSLATTATGH